MIYLFINCRINRKWSGIEKRCPRLGPFAYIKLVSSGMVEETDEPGENHRPKLQQSNLNKFSEQVDSVKDNDRRCRKLLLFVRAL